MGEEETKILTKYKVDPEVEKVAEEVTGLLIEEGLVADYFFWAEASEPPSSDQIPLSFASQPLGRKHLPLLSFLFLPIRAWKLPIINMEDNG